MGDVDHGRIRGLLKAVPTEGTLSGPKSSRSVALRDVVGNKVAKYQEFFADVLIDTDNFFLYVRRQVAAADERVVSIWDPGRYHRICHRQRATPEHSRLTD